MKRCHRSDHAVLSWTIPTEETPKLSLTIPKVSKAATAFCADAGKAFCDLPDRYDSPREVVEAAERLDDSVIQAWRKHAQVHKNSARARSWWNEKCAQLAHQLRDMRDQLRTTRRNRASIARQPGQAAEEARRQLRGASERICRIIDATHRQLKSTVRRAKQKFFDEQMNRMHSQKIWDAVQWTRPRRVDSTTSIVQEDGSSADTTEDIQRAFQQQFTPSTPKQIDTTILEEFSESEHRSMAPISVPEVRDCLQTTSNTSAPGPDHLSWFWLKRVASTTPSAIDKLCGLYNACIEFQICPPTFKASHTIVIPKPNKPDYTKAKAYRPIVLLNCTGKLLEKVLAKRIQFEAQQQGIMHPSQYGGTMQHSTIDAGVQLVHNVKQAWKRGLMSSALLLDVSQFYPSIHHGLMTSIMRRQGFDHRLCNFMDDFLTGRQTRFLFNGRLMDPLEFNVGLGQGSALSPVLSGLYIAPILHKIAPTTSNLYGNSSLQFFVDDGLIYTAAPPPPRDCGATQIELNCAIIAHIFKALVTDLRRVGLNIEQDKLEFMHFWNARTPWSKAHPYGPPIALEVDGELCKVEPKQSMRYLGFYLDPRLSFREHVRRYATKGVSTLAAMRMLGNSMRGFHPINKRRLYIANVLTVMTYGAQLWWNPTWKGLKWAARLLQKTQARAARWITGCFRTTPIGALEIMAGLIPIKIQINRLLQNAALRTRVLHTGHPLRASLTGYWEINNKNITAPFPLGGGRQDAKTPLTFIDIYGRLSNETFEPLHPEAQPGRRVIDEFANRIEYHHCEVGSERTVPRKGDEGFEKWLKGTFEPEVCAIVSDKDARTVWTDGSQTNKAGLAAAAAWLVCDGTRHRAHGSFGIGKATPYDAEMAALAKGISEATRTAPTEVRSIHIFVDNLAAANAILRAKVGPAQMASIAACESARKFLDDPGRKIHVHWCPSHVGIAGNEFVDKEAQAATKRKQPDSVSKAIASAQFRNTAMSKWHTSMKSKEYRGNQFWPLNFRKHIGRASKSNWFLKHNGTRNTDMARTCRFWCGHFPHGDFRTRFHLPGRTGCWCGQDSESREHILFECPLWIRKAHWRIQPDQGDINTNTCVGNVTRTDIAWFLDMNPMVATFMWCDMLEEAERDIEKGHTNSIACARVWTWTRGRKEAWGRRSSVRSFDYDADVEAERMAGSLEGVG